MRRGLALGLLAAAALLAAGCRSSGSGGDPGPVDRTAEAWWPRPDAAGIRALPERSAFFTAHEHLITGMSTWFEVTEYREPGAAAQDSSGLGYYGVGNGRVFGFVGTSHPRNTLHELLGPDYQRGNQGYFSDFRAKLELAGRPLKWTRDHIWRLREAQVVLTSMQVQGTDLELDTITFAPRSDAPGAEQPTIVQVLNVRNAGVTAVAEVDVRVQSYAGADRLDEAGVFLEQVRDHHRLRVRPAAPADWTLVAQSEQRFPALVTDPFALPPGAERQLVMVYEFTPADGTPGAGREAVRAAGWAALLADTVDWWERWHRAGLQVRTPDARVNDLLEVLKSTIRVQTSYSGSVSPMSHHTFTWLRDCYAPVRTWLKLGYPDEARGVMDYLFQAATVNGGLANALETNLEIPDPLPARDWYADMPFAGRIRGEGPSHLPLMSTWYWRYTGDGAPVDDRWDFLLHALKGQPQGERPGHAGLLHFSGDETFRPQLSANIGLPGGASYKFEELTYSANSAFLFVRAAELLAGYGRATGVAAADLDWLEAEAARVREATERHYWLAAEGRYSPFVYIDTLEADPHAAEDVNTQPVWLDYLDGDDPQARQNIESTWALIGQDNGLLQNIPTEAGELLDFDTSGGLMTGMAPAYFLYNATELDLPIAETTFDTVPTYLSPSGNAHEVGLFAQPERAFCPIYFDDSVMGELYGRFREWEGAIVAEAIVNHLVGFEADVVAGWVRLAPRLVHGSTWLEVDNLMFAGHRLSLVVERVGDLHRYRITSDDDPATFGLTEYRLWLPVELAAVEQVRVTGAALATGDFQVAEPRPGLLRVRLTVAARAGETVIVVTGEP